MPQEQRAGLAQRDHLALGAWALTWVGLGQVILMSPSDGVSRGLTQPPARALNQGH